MYLEVFSQIVAMRLGGRIEVLPPSAGWNYARTCVLSIFSNRLMAVAEHDNQGGFRQDNLRDLTLFFRTLSGDIQFLMWLPHFFDLTQAPSH